MKVIVNNFSMGLLILITILYSNIFEFNFNNGILEPYLILNMAPILPKKEQEVICQKKRKLK